MPGRPRQHDNIYHPKCKFEKQLLFHCLISRSFCVATPTKSYSLCCKTSDVFNLCYYVLFSFLSFVSNEFTEERELICYMAPVNDFANGFYL